MEHEHLTDLKTGKPKLKVSCPQCGKVFEDLTVERCSTCINADNKAPVLAATSRTTTSLSQENYTVNQLTCRTQQEDAQSITIAQPANFKQRFLATIIDELLLGTLVTITSLPVIALVGQYFLVGGLVNNMDQPSPSFIAAIIIYALSFTIPYLYISLFEASKLSATPGKYLLGLKVVSDQNGKISLSDSLAKALSQGLFYIPVIILFGGIILFPIIYCLNLIGLVANESNGQVLLLCLNGLLVLFGTAFATFPWFRKGSQSFMDLISNRFVVNRHSAQLLKPVALNTAESLIHWLHHLTSIVFWLPATLLVLAIPTLLYFAFGNLLADEFLGLGLLLISWISCLWLIWRFRKTAGPIIAKGATGIIIFALVTSTIFMLPENTSRIANTPKALSLIEQALNAKAKGEKTTYEKLRIEARALPSFALSYYVMHNSLWESPQRLTPEAYCGPRIRALTSPPGKSDSKYDDLKEKH